MRTLLGPLALALAALAGCAAPTTAVINGQRVARPSLGYTDEHYFAIRHQLAYPEMRGPSSGLWSYGGRIDGSVCGLDVRFESDYYGRHLDVSGFVRPAAVPDGRTRSARFYVRDSRRGREIFGNIGGRVSPIELYLRPDAVVGQIGTRHYRIDEPHPEEDELRGTVRLNTWMGEQTLTFILRGIQEFWAMPPADQAVLMPLMLSCLDGGAPGARGPIWEPVVIVDFRRPAPPAPAVAPAPAAPATPPAAPAPAAGTPTASTTPIVNN